MLALVGSGEYLPAMEAVDRELIGCLAEPARVVCLPTAAGAEGHAKIAYWCDLGVAHFARLGVQVEAVRVVDRSSACDPVLAGRIAAANFVYLSGGRPDYLYRTLQGSPAWRAIQAVLAAGGILAGCSAGAMILGEKFFAFPGWRSGFTLVPGVTIIPHFDEIPAAVVAPIRLLAGSRLTVVGIDGNTALVQTNGGYSVVGSGAVTLWHADGRQRFGAGPLPDPTQHRR